MWVVKLSNCELLAQVIKTKRFVERIKYEYAAIWIFGQLGANGIKSYSTSQARVGVKASGSFLL